MRYIEPYIKKYLHAIKIFSLAMGCLINIQLFYTIISTANLNVYLYIYIIHIISPILMSIDFNDNIFSDP